MKTINLPPYAPTLIESTRAMGYSLVPDFVNFCELSHTASSR